MPPLSSMANSRSIMRCLSTVSSSPFVSVISRLPSDKRWMPGKGSVIQNARLGCASFLRKGQIIFVQLPVEATSLLTPLQLNLIVVKPAAGFAAEPAGGNVFLQKRAGAVFGIAEAF